MNSSNKIFPIQFYSRGKSLAKKIILGGDRENASCIDSPKRYE